MRTEFLRRKQASHYLQEQYGISCATSTLAKYATIGSGPKYSKFNRFPLYAKSDLDIWVQERMSTKYTSTSEYCQ